MRDSSLETARTILEEAAQVTVLETETEEEIRQKAYEYMLEEDFLLAHVVRLGKEWRQFTKDEWQGVH